jgi:WD40 repeat protein
LWDVDTGACLHTFAGHEQAVRAVAVSSDGKLIASASDDRTARVWDVASGDQIAQLEGHAGAVRGVAFLPDGSLLTAGRDGTLRTWDIQTEAPLWVSLHEDCALVLAVSADGKRAAYGGCLGVTYVWDLVQKRRIGQFGDACGCSVISVALNADGSRVYASVADKLRQPWNVDTGQEVPPPATTLAGAFGLSHDGKRLACSIRDVVDPDTHRSTHTLQLFSSGSATCFEFSADHNVLAAGYGGYDGANGWVPGRGNLIEVYRLPDPNAPVVTGEPAGSVSWEAIPTTVRELATGNVVPLEGKSWQSRVGASGNWRWKIRNVDAELPGAGHVAADVFLETGVVLMQREKGQIREILCDSEAGYSDLTWDGQNFWVGSKVGGVFAFNLDGKVVATIGPAHGLPAATGGMCLYAIGPDRILVAGTSQPTEGGGWCAVIEPDPAATQPAVGGGKSYRVKMVLKEADIHDGWGGDFNGAHIAGGSIFTPLFITEPPGPGDGAKYQRSIWVVCQGIPRSWQPIVKIDPETLAFSTYNLETNARERGKPTSPHKPAVMAWDVAPLWLSSDSVIARGAFNDYFTLRPGVAMLDDVDKTLLCDIGTYNLPPPVAFAGQVYLPGQTWFQLSPATRQALRLGPGLRSADGVALHGDGVTYYASAAMNSLAAFAPLDGCIYRISTDPTHPAPLRATLEPVLPVTALPKEGRVIFGPDRTSFECGGGLLEFGLNELRSRPGAGRAVLAVEARIGFSLAEASRMKSRLIENASERQRIGLTAAQLIQLKKNASGFTAVDAKRLLKLLYVFRTAEPGPAQREATRPILDEAAALGQKWKGEAEASLSEFRKIFSDQQWQLLEYEK